MLDEDPFLLQLAGSIQAWLWVETELYLLYAMFLQGANSHLISVTFNSIHSFEAKLNLINSFFALVFERNSEGIKNWKAMRTKLAKLNERRNKLVHEPCIHSGQQRIQSHFTRPLMLQRVGAGKGANHAPRCANLPSPQPSPADAGEGARDTSPADAGEGT